MGSNSSVVVWVLVAYAVILVVWLLLPRWRARRGQRAVTRAQGQGLGDPLSSDPELLRTCQEDLAQVVGEQPIDRLEKLQALLGPGNAKWVLRHVKSRKRDTYRLDAVGCDVVRVLSRGDRGPAQVVVRVAVRLPGRPSPRGSAEAFWTMTKTADKWTRTAVEGYWDGRRPTQAPDAYRHSASE